MKFKKKPNPQTKAEQVVQEAAQVDARFDPNGSYTGKPVCALETPVQDADDL